MSMEPSAVTHPMQPQIFEPLIAQRPSYIYTMPYHKVTEFPQSRQDSHNYRGMSMLHQWREQRHSQSQQVLKCSDLAILAPGRVIGCGEWECLNNLSGCLAPC